MIRKELKTLLTTTSVFAGVVLSSPTLAAQNFSPYAGHNTLSSLGTVSADTININYPTYSYTDQFDVDQVVSYWININIGNLSPDALTISTAALSNTAGTTISSVTRDPSNGTNTIQIKIADGLRINLASADALSLLQLGTASGGSSVYISSTAVVFPNAFTSVGTNNTFSYYGASGTFNGNIGAAGDPFTTLNIGEHLATFNGKVYATTINNGSNDTSFTNTLNANTVNLTAPGTTFFAGNIAGVSGANATIKLSEGAKVELGNNVTLNGTVVNDSGISGNNTAIIIDQNATVTGDIGTASKLLSSLEMKADGVLNAGGSVFVDAASVDTDNIGTLTLNRNADTALTGKVGSVNDNFILGGSGNAQLLKVINIGAAGANTYTLSGEVIGAYNIKFVNGVNPNTTLKLGAASNNTQYILGGIQSASGSVGIVNIGGVVVSSAIGSNNTDKPLNILLGNANSKLLTNSTALYAGAATFSSSNTQLTFINGANASINAPVVVSSNGYGSITADPSIVQYTSGQFSVVKGSRFTHNLSFASGSTVGVLNGNALGLLDVQDGTVTFGDNAHIISVKAANVSVGTGKTLKADTIKHYNASGIDDGGLSVSVLGALNATTIHGNVSLAGGELKVTTVNGNLTATGAATGVISSVSGKLSVGALAADTFIVGNVTGSTSFTGDGNLSLSDGGTLGEVSANTLGNGVLKLLGSARLNNDLQRIKSLTLSGASGKVIEFMGRNIQGNVTQGVSTLSLNENTTINGTYNATGSTLDLANKKTHTTLDVTSATTLQGAVTINAVYDGAPDYYIADFSGGGGLSYGGLTSLTVNMSTLSSVPEDLEVQLLKVGTVADIAQFNNLIRVNDPLPIFAWQTSKTKAGAFILLKDTEQFGANFHQAFIDASKTLTALYNGQADSRFEIEAARILAASPAAFKELVTRIDSSVTNPTSSAVVSRVATSQLSQISQIPQFSVGTVATVLTSRMDSVGVAAGSAHDKFGAWTNIQGSSARQGLYKDASGFTSKGVGVVVGADAKLDDRMLLGFAVGNNATNVKHKDTLAGDKTRVSSLLLGLYGQYQVSDRIFVRATGIISQSTIDNKSRRVAGVGVYGIARAKYDVISLGLDTAVGYVIPISDKATITPTVGAKLYHTNSINYVETGNTIQNNTVTQKDMNTMSINAGVMAATEFESENGTIILPSLSVLGEYGLGAKSPKGTFVNQGTPTLTHDYVGTKPARFIGTLGCGLDAMHDSIEYGVNYNLRLATKYISHEGSVKFRVRF